MLLTTRGVVLHTTPYNDTYDIVHIYTEQFGRMPYLVGRRRSRKSDVARSAFRPLSILEIEVDHQPRRDIQRIRETRTHHSTHSIATHPIKSIIALFAAETAFRIVQTREADERLFHFLVDSVRKLEIAENGIANFHLVFLIGLIRCLGIAPTPDGYRPGAFFDLVDGVFTPFPPIHSHCLEADESVVLWRLLRMDYGNMAIYAFSGRERSAIIRRIFDYCRLHLTGFTDVKSLAVMQTLFE